MREFKRKLDNQRLHVFGKDGVTSRAEWDGRGECIPLFFAFEIYEVKAGLIYTVHSFIIETEDGFHCPAFDAGTWTIKRLAEKS